jgi:hypothetical protein
VRATKTNLGMHAGSYKNILKHDYMKSFSFLALIFIIISISNVQAQDSISSVNNYGIKSQPPYRASVGGITPYTSLAFGPSFKAFFTDQVAFQTDIFFKEILTAGKDVYINETAFAFYLSVETNVNFIYQKKIKEKAVSELFWLIGGGVSLGYSLTPVSGKFGVNAIVGLEYVFKKKPLAIQIDFRPGYGLLFTNYAYVEAMFTTLKNPWSHFDWFIGATLRYAFNNKQY